MSGFNQNARGGGYGLDADLAQKASLKYDIPKEKEAQAWIEECTGSKFPGGTFADALKDGTILCGLMNTLQPGTIRKVEQSKMPFKQMENIVSFLFSRLCLVLFHPG